MFSQLNIYESDLSVLELVTKVTSLLCFFSFSPINVLEPQSESLADVFKLKTC